jgi:hypothetical protein
LGKGVGEQNGFLYEGKIVSNYFDLFPRLNPCNYLYIMVPTKSKAKILQVSILIMKRHKKRPDLQTFAFQTLL